MNTGLNNVELGMARGSTSQLEDLAPQRHALDGVQHPHDADIRREEQDQQDEQQEQEQVRIFITGFGPFAGITVNPTQILVDGLRDDNQFWTWIHADNQKSTKVVLEQCQVMKVCAKTVKATLQEMHREILTKLRNELAVEEEHMKSREKPRKRVVFLHFGVHSVGKRFFVERQAFNEAHFGYPDESGWQPRFEKIDPRGVTPNATLRTTVHVKQLVDRLKAKSFDVVVSDDAGRYVCNWTYYNSMYLANSHGVAIRSFGTESQLDPINMPDVTVQVLFVHVPPFETIPEDIQVQFVRELIKCMVAPEDVVSQNSNAKVGSITMNASSSNTSHAAISPTRT